MRKLHMITSFPLKMKRYPACVGHRTVAELSTRLNCYFQKTLVWYYIVHDMVAEIEAGLVLEAVLNGTKLSA